MGFSDEMCKSAKRSSWAIVLQEKKDIISCMPSRKSQTFHQYYQYHQYILLQLGQTIFFIEFLVTHLFNDGVESALGTDNVVEVPTHLDEGFNGTALNIGNELFGEIGEPAGFLLHLWKQGDIQTYVYQF